MAEAARETPWHQAHREQVRPRQPPRLLEIKQSLGYVDPRCGLKECELCDNDEWRPGVTCQVPQKPEPTVGLDAEAEAAVQAITDQILARLR